MSQTYRVNDIYPTIQGEGALSGTPMILLRLQGCGVGCPWCDTKETWVASPEGQKATLDEALGTGPFWAEMTAGQVVDHLKQRFAGNDISWILLTGGEPAEQPIDELMRRLRDEGYFICLETSGTAPLPPLELTQPNHVCVSPKWDMPGGKAVLPDVLRRADEIKAVIGKPEDIDRLKAAIKSLIGMVPTISLQPLSGNIKATQLCIDACLENGWNLSIQTHKLMGLR